MRAARQAVATAFAAMAIGSCREVIAVDDPAPPITCPQAALGSMACNECVHAGCCAELAACEGDAPCRSLLECRVSCTDDACRARCENTWHRSGSTSALLACESARCDTACGRACGGVGAPVQDCKECGRSCCALGASLAGSVDARAFVACRNACGANGECREGCSSRHLEGANLELSLRECVNVACNVSGDWTCLGRDESTRPTTAVITVSITAVDVGSLLPIGGVTVRGCPDPFGSCENAFGTTTTDGQGRASVDVTLRPGNGLDAFDGYLELSHEAFAPELVYFSPSLTHSVSTIAAMIQTTKLSELGAAAGFSLAADRGAVVAGVGDCTGALRSGVEVKVASADAQSHAFYFGKVSAGASQFDFSATSTSDVGYGGAYDVPAGRTSVEATVAGLCAKVGTADVLVRPRAVTVAMIGATR